MQPGRALLGLLATLIPLLIILDRLLRKEPEPIHNSIRTGAIYYHEIINHNSSTRFKQITRMTKPVFLRLLRLLEEEGGLESTQLCSGEKLMIFIQVLKGHSVREIGELWQHSNETISRATHTLIHAFKNVKGSLFFNPPNGTPATILNNPKFYPYFQDCIGALDGTHIPAVVSYDEQSTFRNRKGVISQNVLAVCNFDMTYSYALCGWEGSAHDGKVLRDAYLKGLTVPEGKYWLGDAGYGLTKKVLTPYRGVRYHLKEWGAAGLVPLNAQELFNLRHSSARNVIERLFGVTKKRFPILNDMPSYDITTQIDLIMCCFMLHNFIRRYEPLEDEFYVVDEVDNDDDDDVNNALENDAAMSTFRDALAASMWADYQVYVANHQTVDNKWIYYLIVN